MKRYVAIIVALMVITMSVPFTSQAAPPSQTQPNDMWLAEYFDNPSLSGYPVIAFAEEKLNHNWGDGGPALSIPVDNFSARWTSTRHFKKGVHVFILNVDDGARVWLGGSLIIDAWGIGGTANLRTKVYIEKEGEYQVQVAYFEKTGNASISMESFLMGGQYDFTSTWYAQYYSNRYLAGEPDEVRLESAINFNWNIGSPSIKVTRDNFSARWERSSYLPTGNYQLRVRHDDGMRIFINGELIYNSWLDQPAVNKAINIYLEEGNHNFVVMYYDHLGSAVAQVDLFGP